MFTGLIESLGYVREIRKAGNSAVLKIEAEISEPSIGASIAINGVCLTVTEIKSKALSFDVSAETLKAANLGSLRPGDRVNIEQAMRADARLGGHFVTGHADTVGKIRSKSPLGDMHRFDIACPEWFAGLLVPKGSVALDGISLTVVEVLNDGFTIVIIPHTAKLTTLGFKGPGDTVNLEADILGKYVLRYMSRSGSSDAGFLKTLKEGGFTEI